MALRSGGHADGSGGSNAGVSTEAGDGGEGGARGAGAADGEGRGAAGGEGKGVVVGGGGGRGGEDVSTRVVMDVLKVGVLAPRLGTRLSKPVHYDEPVRAEWKIGIVTVVPLIFGCFPSLVECVRTQVRRKS